MMGTGTPISHSSMERISAASEDRFGETMVRMRNGSPFVQLVAATSSAVSGSERRPSIAARLMIAAA